MVKRLNQDQIKPSSSANSQSSNALLPVKHSTILNEDIVERNRQRGEFLAKVSNEGSSVVGTTLGALWSKVKGYGSTLLSDAPASHKTKAARNVGLSALSALMSVATFNSGVGLTKNFFSKDTSKVPFFFKALEFLTTASVTTGLVNTLRGAGLAFDKVKSAAMAFAALGVTKFMNSAYTWGSANKKQGLLSKMFGWMFRDSDGNNTIGSMMDTMVSPLETIGGNGMSDSGDQVITPRV